MSATAEGRSIAQEVTPPGTSPDAALAHTPQSSSPESLVSQQQHHSSSHVHDPVATLSDFDLSLWDPSTSLDFSQLIDDTNTVPKPADWTEFIDCGCPRPHVQVSSSSGGPREYRSFPSANGDHGPGHTPTDLFSNTLRLQRVCIVQAILANCLHVGVTEDMLCDYDAISPFFRPCGGNLIHESGSDGVVKTMQNIFKGLSPDMRPTREQITTLHHPMIDIIPFPTFRKNILRNKDMVTEEQLYYDLITGLICWGSTPSQAQQRRRPRDVSSCWDYRSWEARPWFLQKYWAQLGGEEGELVRQSQWWQSMRNDDPVI